MTQYALMQHGRITNVVTTSRSKAEVQQRYPEYTVQPLDSLPTSICEQYQYWDERP